MKEKYRMDGHKLNWHLDRVREWAKGERIAPLHLDLGITTGCNLACRYCYGILQGRTGYGTDFKKRFDMPEEVVVKLMKDSKRIGVRSIAFIGEGENTLNKALYPGLETAKKISLDTSLATNGIILRKEKIPLMLDALTWLRINISAATPESYAFEHQTNPQVLDKVIRNTERIVEEREKNNYNTTLGFQMVITKTNIEQIVKLAELGKNLGIDYTVFKSCSDTSDKKLDSPDEEYLEMEPLFKEAENHSTDKYSVIIKRAKLKNLGVKNYEKCFGTQFIPGISGNGNVFPCGHWFNIRSDEFLMGNIIENSLEEIINSDRYWEVQKKVSKKVNVNKDCETNCRQHYINQDLWKLKTGEITIKDMGENRGDNPPEHVNFI
jgi:radical SAM protein with 4Fe4S-binding SPASM domain